MVKTIELVSQFGKFQERTSFKLCDNEDLEIALCSSLYGNADFYLNIGSESFKFKNNRVLVPRKFLKIGELYLGVSIYVNNSFIKKYSCEPLIIDRVQGGYEAIPEIVKQNEEIEKLRQEVLAVNELKDKYNEVLKELKIVKQIVYYDTNLKLGE